MTQKEELLLLELCARLPFRICTNLPNHHLVSHKYIIHEINIQNGWTTGILDCAGRIQIYGAKVEDIKPYLRPMSSITDVEMAELNCLCYYNIDVQDGALYGRICADEINDVIEFLNKNMFDYRRLIEKGLAIEAPEGMYKEEQQ